jgi:pilus assembly protein CpaF
MAGLASTNFSEHLMNLTVARALNLIIHLNRFPDGRRRVISLSEITGMEGSVITTQEIFVFDQLGVDADGNVMGELKYTGIRPRCMDRIIRAGGFQGGTAPL